MPVTFPPLNRRRFISLALAAGAGALLPRPLFAAEKQADPNYFALISDLHLHANRDFVYHNDTGASDMWRNFQQVSREVLALPTQPAAVLINGDVAFHEGRPEDYATAMAAMIPLREGGLPVHWALGNHDDRMNIAQAAAPDSTLVPELADRRVMMFSSPLANIFMMDSLKLTNKTPGLLGEEQLAWLAAALDRHTDRPAIVLVHHNPFLRRPATLPDQSPAWGKGTLLSDYVQSQLGLEHPASTNAPSDATYGQTTVAAVTAAKPAANEGLIDTIPLLNVLLPRKQVKVWFFGHTHAYSHKQVEGLHLVNLPATGYLFAKNQPLGWMDMRVQPTGAKLQLNCLVANHPRQHDQLDLEWRT
jgi:Icc protein